MALKGAVMAETVTRTAFARMAGEERPAKRAEVSRQQILDVAASLFRARGYTETSLRDIAALVGMKAGSLYYHFTSKEELAAEVLRIGVERVHEVVAAAVAALGPRATMKARIEAAIAAHLETLLVESDYTSAHIRCFPYVPPAIKAGLADTRRAYEGVWKRLLGEAAAAGALAPGIDPDVARLAILGALNWSLEWFDPERGRPEELIRTLVAGFTR
ncbi:TetR/AcrR family transcriptional regulator [Phreatobacter sp. AB_2022a]|uniref:TetR/AcrR family transcriptional regulator n=1 Tax=Phreatobacter sp. AB_2022a TaxID=3003134 RepID=UPI0022876F6B|nr:TetR/AcrR family transcriptional regulator [Phreatobacter sp. AB_2022a]MCZ0734260.1 TetR/AcrR family transcriptional regulator [Phreatobacter sp. AB_2022a]